MLKLRYIPLLWSAVLLTSLVYVVYNLTWTLATLGLWYLSVDKCSHTANAVKERWSFDERTWI
jgi:hypothetical protein